MRKNRISRCSGVKAQNLAQVLELFPSLAHFMRSLYCPDSLVAGEQAAHKLQSFICRALHLHTLSFT